MPFSSAQISCSSALPHSQKKPGNATATCPQVLASPGPQADISPKLSVICRTRRTIPNVNSDTGSFDAGIPPPKKENVKPLPSTMLVKHRTVAAGNKQALGYRGMHCVPEDRDLKEAEERKEGLYVEVGDERDS